MNYPHYLAQVFYALLLFAEFISPAFILVFALCLCQMAWDQIGNWIQSWTDPGNT